MAKLLAQLLCFSRWLVVSPRAQVLGDTVCGPFVLAALLEPSADLNDRNGEPPSRAGVIRSRSGHGCCRVRGHVISLIRLPPFFKGPCHHTHAAPALQSSKLGPSVRIVLAPSPHSMTVSAALPFPSSISLLEGTAVAAKWETLRPIQVSGTVLFPTRRP